MNQLLCFLWPSLLLALARRRRLQLVGAVAGSPKKRRAENADDAQVEDDADDQRSDGPEEGRRRSVGLEPRPP